MKVFTYSERLKKIEYKLIDQDPNGILYFDIETTGLSAATSTLYMLGYATLCGEDVNITLLFNDDGNSEKALLESFAETIKSYTHLISYNGDTFDIPYIKEKCRAHGLPNIFENIASLDIYRKIRRYKKLLHLDAMKQSNVEEMLGLYRKEFTSGGELIGVYKLYLRTRREDLLQDLVTHNKDDIAGLALVTNALALPHLLDGNFEVADAHLTSTHLVINLTDVTLPFRLNFSHKDILFNGMNEKMMIQVPLVKGVLKHFFTDYKNYFYLPAEDMAIHKSVGAYVDGDHRQKATKETAYVKKEGTFMTCFDKSADMTFKTELKSKETYLEVTDTFVADKVALKNYISSILKEIS